MAKVLKFDVEAREKLMEGVNVLADAVKMCLGTAKSVKITKDHTTIIEGAGEKEDIDNLVAQLKSQIESTESEYEKNNLQERVARIVGGCCCH